MIIGTTRSKTVAGNTVLNILMTLNAPIQTKKPKFKNVPTTPKPVLGISATLITTKCYIITAAKNIAKLTNQNLIAKLHLSSKTVKRMPPNAITKYAIILTTNLKLTTATLSIAPPIPKHFNASDPTPSVLVNN